MLLSAAYNGKVGLRVLCLVTRQANGYSFEVQLPSRFLVEGSDPGRSSEQRGFAGLPDGECVSGAAEDAESALLRKRSMSLAD